MKTKKRFIEWLCLLFVCMFSFMLSACSSSGDDSTVADEGQLVEVPDFDENTWVTDSDIKSEDLDQLVDLAVKVERIRQELFLMLSNGGEGDKPFCGVGPKTDVGPTIKLVTDMLEKEDKYREVLDRLDGTAILSPTATRGKLKNLWDIITTGRTEAEAEKEKVQEILTANKVYGNTNAQQQLYDFYCSQEPDYAKKINAKDAKDFFNKLNNGELNNYMLNISHIWRDKGILEADKATSAVGDYAYTAFTGKPEYLNSAYRVSSKVAVAAGELYLTAIDDYAGGYGAKIMEFGDAIQNKITKLKLMKKFLEGKPDWQGVNKYVVDNLKSDIQDAISDALGDDSIGKDIVEMVTEEILDWVAEQCTSDDEGGESSEEAEKKKDELAKQDDIAILNIETDFSSQGKMILVTDEATGKVHVATPTYDGHVSIVTTPGSKLVTVIKKNGERLTKRFTATAGSNTLIIKSEQAPYIDLNPSSISHEDDAGSEAAIVLTNMKYIKLRKPNKEEWWDVQLEINGSAGRGTHVRVIYKANLEEKERKGSFILEGYKEKDDAKPSVTKTIQFTQDPYTTELTPIDVSPTSLLFDVEGGVQTVKVDIKNYKYCGGFNEEGSDDWLSVIVNNDATLTVKAKPNDTGVERTGTIYAFGTDDPDPKTLDQVAFKVIPVTQKGENGQLIIEGCGIEFYLKLHNWSYNIDPKYQELKHSFASTFRIPNLYAHLNEYDDESQGKWSFDVKNTGNGYHVNAIRNQYKSVYFDEIPYDMFWKISFDVQVGDGHFTKISDIKYLKMDREFDGDIRDSAEIKELTYKETVYKNNYGYVGHSCYIDYFEASQEKGNLDIYFLRRHSDFTYKYSDAERQNYNYTLVDNPENKVEFSVRYNKVANTRRRSASKEKEHTTLNLRFLPVKVK